MNPWNIHFLLFIVGGDCIDHVLAMQCITMQPVDQDVNKDVHRNDVQEDNKASEGVLSEQTYKC